MDCETARKHLQEPMNRESKEQLEAVQHLLECSNCFFWSMEPKGKVK